MIKTVRAHQPWSNLYFFFCDNPTLFIIFYLSFNHIWDDSLCSKSSFPFPFPLLAIFPPFLQTESLFIGNVWWALLPGLATGRPLGERSEPFLAAKRPTASDEVARGRPVPYEIRRRTFLKVYWPGAWKKSKVRNLASSLMSILFSSTSLYLFCKQCLFLMLMRK